MTTIDTSVRPLKSHNSQFSTNTAPKLPTEIAAFDRSILSIERSKGWAMESQFGPRMQLSILRAALKLAHEGVQLGLDHPDHIKVSNQLIRAAATIIWGNSFGIGGGRTMRDFRMAHRITTAMDKFREKMVLVFRSHGEQRESALHELGAVIREVASEGREAVKGLSPLLPRKKIDSFAEKHCGDEIRNLRTYIAKALRGDITPEERARHIQVETGIALIVLGLEHLGSLKRHNACTLWSGAMDVLPKVKHSQDAPLSDAIKDLGTLSGIVFRESEDIPHQLALRVQLVIDTIKNSFEKMAYAG